MVKNNLNKCISSILLQKYKKFEVIFYDNFSTDSSKKIIQNFKDKRIKYYFSKKTIFTLVMKRSKKQDIIL